MILRPGRGTTVVWKTLLFEYQSHMSETPLRHTFIQIFICFKPEPDRVFSLDAQGKWGCPCSILAENRLICWRRNLMQQHVLLQLDCHKEDWGMCEMPQVAERLDLQQLKHKQVPKIFCIILRSDSF